MAGHRISKAPHFLPFFGPSESCRDRVPELSFDGGARPGGYKQQKGGMPIRDN